MLKVPQYAAQHFLNLFIHRSSLPPSYLTCHGTQMGKYCSKQINKNTENAVTWSSKYVVKLSTFIIKKKSDPKMNKQEDTSKGSFPTQE